MRAVNLIPSEAGRGGHGGAGVGPYVLLGVLGLLLAGVVAYVLTSNQLVDRRAQLASLQAQAHAAQAQADATRPYRDFAAMAQARIETVRQLGATRFDWHRAFADLARVIPNDVWLTSLLGTVTTGVSVEGAGSGDTATLRSALPNPAIEMTGCTTGHDEVARLLSRLRLLTGVVRVSLADSSKADAGGGGGDSSDCRHGHARFPQFGLVIFFAPLPAAPVPAQQAAGAPAAPAPAPSAGSPAASAAASGNGSGMR
jgi:Tfp pilus assembly protein PilN